MFMILPIEQCKQGNFEENRMTKKLLLRTRMKKLKCLIYLRRKKRLSNLILKGCIDSKRSIGKQQFILLVSSNRRRNIRLVNFV